VRALDTNVLARFFVDDPDDAQAARQRPAAIAALSQRSYVSVTVLLELEWVLRGFYELAAKDVSKVLRALASIPHVTLEDRDSVLLALDALDKGLDFADALHVVRASRASSFVTFDRRLVKRAQNVGLPVPVESLPRVA
jgi:predicted nucleic-acid-binding protein